MLKKAYAKIAALRKIKRLVPSNVMITLYKTYVLPNFEYCSPLLLGISRSLNNKLERANHYALRSILNLGSSVTYDACLSIASMTSIEQRRVEHSLIVFFQSFRMHVACVAGGIQERASVRRSRHIPSRASPAREFTSGEAASEFPACHISYGFCLPPTFITFDNPII